jgi:putative membrane protein (TIGR04086 family)
VNRPLDLDSRAVLDGALVAAMIAIPVQVLARLTLDEDTRSGWASFLAFVIIAGLILGAGVAAWRQERGTPLTHGIITALGVFVAVQVVGIVVNAVQGDPIRWGRIATSFALSMVAGILGGMLGSFLLRRGVRPTR